MYKNKKMGKAIVAVVLAAALAGCATPMHRAEGFAIHQDWMKAVLEYRKALAAHPDDIEIKARLQQAELKAADYYYQRGAKLMDEGDLDGAIVEFQKGLTAKPDHDKLVQSMKAALARKDAMASYREGVRNLQIGKLTEAHRNLKAALDIYPGFKEAAVALDKVEEEQKKAAGPGLALTSKAPITLNFHNTNIRTAFDFIAKAFGINVIFDEAVTDSTVTLFARQVTFEQSLNLLLTTTKTFYKRVGPNTILVIPDTEAKRGQYEDYIIRTFSLNNIRAKDMLNVIKGVVNVKKAILNEELNTITIRDTADVLSLVKQLIDVNDRKPAEIMVDVEILEVNRTKAEVLGVDWGSQASVAFPQYTLNTSSLGEALQNGVVTLPNITFNYFKQDVDAKTLANPKVRVLNEEKAKIHIGDRVPLRSSTIVDATGQTRTTYDYKDIGIALNVQPNIHLDNSVTVKLGLEVSTLGRNLGTADEPAYSIGTRTANTVMLLRDGETAILGGLISDDDRDTRVHIPGLGDVPVIGSLFGTKDTSGGRTDVLLTITPRVVRAWDVPSKEARSFYSGTENTYSTHALFAYLGSNAQGGSRPQISVGNASIPVASSGGTPAASGGVPGGPQTAGAGGAPVLTFSQPTYQVAADGKFDIVLVGKNIKGVKKIPVKILYNPEMLTFDSARTGTGISGGSKVQADAQKGELELTLGFGAKGAPAGDVELAHLTMRGAKRGISYLVYSTPTLDMVQGKQVGAQVRASRVLVK